MPKIVGHFPMEEDPARQEPCVLCLEPTSTRAKAPGLGSDVELPLHVLCAGWLVRAYGKLERGFALSEGESRQVFAYIGRVKELGAR